VFFLRVSTKVVSSICLALFIFSLRTQISAKASQQPDSSSNGAQIAPSNSLDATLKTNTPAPEQQTRKPSPDKLASASKLQQEISKALTALHKGFVAEAQHHADAAFKLDHSNASVDFVEGLVASRANDLNGARSWWDKSIALDPTNITPMLALGQFLILRQDLDAAESYGQRAHAADPNAWRPEQLLAVVSLRREAYPDALAHAQHALELGHNQANDAKLALAEALIALNKRKDAEVELTSFLAHDPPNELVPMAQQLLKSLRAGPDSMVTDAIMLLPSNPGSAATKFQFVMLPLPQIGLPRWMPADVDESMPSVDSAKACPLQEILAGTARNVQQFVKSVDHFTATEFLDHEIVDDWGFPEIQTKRKFEYVVEISEPGHGYLNVSEYRNGSQDVTQFPDGVATIGLPSIVLIFHPYYHDFYEITCEGLGRWHGAEAWQLHFIQRPGKPSLRTFRAGVAGSSLSIALKGRVWVDKKTLQVLHLKSDLVAPMPQIKLVSEHQDIEFAPVKFRDLKEPMWLPATANIYFDLKGRKFRRHNTYTDYLLFSVEDRQKISAPKEISSSSDTPSTQTETPKP
jgi:tetratricopeptide (TPR) repeat protein